MSKDTIQYFGYGANKTRRMMEAITGSKNLVGRPATLKGYGLRVQRFDQIPDVVLSTAPTPVSPRKIIKDNWPETFETYTIEPDPESEVSGTIWELTSLERELVRDWELIEFGWYKDHAAQLLTRDGKLINVQTEILGDGQETDRIVDGTNYEPWLNDPEDFDRIATKSREEFFARTKQTPEGASIGIIEPQALR